MSETAELVRRCRSGDALAWEELVRQYQSRIYSLALHYLRDPDEARDLAQEVFIQVYRKLDAFRGDEFTPWLMRVGRNQCIDRLRRIKARPPARDVELDDGIDLPSDAMDPHADAQAGEERQLIHRAMGRLSDAYREMILLKEIQGLPLQEIAKMLDLPIGTVKSRSARARVELAKSVVKIDPGYGV
ncbi:MAG: sigma-70 family RNA polymerase sigma factor [Acidobacteriota bacterium]|nr:sigma-70 family RNA polymerase sigma factor [Acidobacteriota bacterium]MDH3786287.1 sigma-70 family RNA polymerase sigma factor [Acidobacteriota bacterium]